MAIFPKVAIVANYQQAIFPDLWWILAKFANFVTFVIFVKPTIIDRPVSSSCFNFYQSFYKFLSNLAFSQNSQLSTCLVCHLIWTVTNLKWIVAQFAMFVIIAICQDAPFFLVNSCQTFDNFLPNSPPSQNLSLSLKSPAINMPLFVISFEYLVKPLMNFWHTRHIYRNLPFVTLLLPWAKEW